MRLGIIAVALLVGTPVAIAILLPPITNLIFPHEIHWSEIQIQQGAVTVNMPNVPRTKKGTNSNGIPFELHGSSTGKMSCDAFSATFQRQPGIELAIRPGILGFAKKYQAVDETIQLESEEFFDLQGIPAVRFTGKIVPRDLEWRQETVLFFAGESMYYISIMEPYRLPQASIRQQIFDSIVISENLKQVYRNSQESAP